MAPLFERNRPTPLMARRINNRGKGVRRGLAFGNMDDYLHNPQSLPSAHIEDYIYSFC
jgi:hypothetical protein